MKNALNRRSLDNVTVVIIAFSGFKDAIASINEQCFKNEESERRQQERRNLSNNISSKSQRSASQNHTLSGSK